jgi:glycerol-3-phosphate O-acyltransferase
MESRTLGLRHRAHVDDLLVPIVLYCLGTCFPSVSSAASLLHSFYSIGVLFCLSFYGAIFNCAMLLRM